MNKFILMAFLGLSLSAFSTNVDLKQSNLVWRASKVTAKHFGKISLKSGNLDIGKDGKIQKGTLIINMDSITIDDLKGEWAGKFIGHIKSKDFFEVKKFPTAKLEVLSDNGKTIKGKLTIKGKTNPVKFDYKKVAGAYQGKMVFDRTKFDMIYGSGSFFKNLGDKMIHNEVALDFNLKVK